MNRPMCDQERPRSLRQKQRIAARDGRRFSTKLVTQGNDEGRASVDGSMTLWRACTLKSFVAQYAHRHQKIARIISLQGGNVGSKFHRELRLPVIVKSTHRTCPHEDF